MPKPISKKTQLGRYWKPKNAKTGLKISEDQLQKQLNDTLDAYGIRYIRIPDWVWNWLTHNAPPKLLKYMSEKFGGMPDNVCFVKLTDSINLCLMIELKSKKGKLHGKQNHWYEDFGVHVSRTPEENIRIVEAFEKQIKNIKSKYNI